MFYRNTSYSVKTFYGVTFNPNETKEVNGYINDPFMIRVDDFKVNQPVKTQKKLSSEPIKKDAPKVKEVVEQLPPEPVKELESKKDLDEAKPEPAKEHKS